MPDESHIIDDFLKMTDDQILERFDHDYEKLAVAVFNSIHGSIFPKVLKCIDGYRDVLKLLDGSPITVTDIPKFEQLAIRVDLLRDEIDNIIKKAEL